VVAASLARFPRNRELPWVAGAVLVTALLMFLSLGEQFTPSDLVRIRDDEARLTAACRRPPDLARARDALAVLVDYYHRDPDQPLPLRGASAADSMRAELAGIRVSLTGTACGADPQLQAVLSGSLYSR
jgi:hypothetical protein